MRPGVAAADPWGVKPIWFQAAERRRSGPYPRSGGAAPASGKAVAPVIPAAPIAAWPTAHSPGRGGGAAGPWRRGRPHPPGTGRGGGPRFAGPLFVGMLEKAGEEGESVP